MGRCCSQRDQKDPVNDTTGKKGIEQMTLITAKTDSERLEKKRKEFEEILEGMVDDLSALSDRLKDGQLDVDKDARQLKQDIRFWLRLAVETEAELHALKRQDANICGSYGIDMDAARVEIGCRLDSLRACCGAGDFSE